MNKEKIIIISSPSGAGKTTICNQIIKKNKNIKLSISYTTRPIKKSENHGKDYFFVKKNQFIKLRKKDFFIESVNNFNYLYGSPFENINKFFKDSKHILFDIDWKGAKKIREKFSHKDIIDFFILPPSIFELKKRLINRGRDNKKEINKRLSLAIKEISHFDDYKYVFVNENIDRTVKDILKIIHHEEMVFKLIKKLNL